MFLPDEVLEGLFWCIARETQEMDIKEAASLLGERWDSLNQVEMGDGGLGEGDRAKMRALYCVQQEEFDAGMAYLRAAMAAVEAKLPYVADMVPMTEEAWGKIEKLNQDVENVLNSILDKREENEAS